MPTSIRQDKNGFFCTSEHGDQKIVRRLTECHNKAQVRKLLRRELKLGATDRLSLAVDHISWDGTQWLDDEAA